MRHLVFGLLCSAMTAFAASRCDTPAELLPFEDSLPAFGQERIAAIEQRLAQSPDSLYLHRLFVDSSVYQRSAQRDRYRKLLEAHPDSLDYQYLYARALVGSKTPEALTRFARILERDGDYPWIHLSQLEIYRADAFRDRARLAASFAVLQRVCPELWKQYDYLAQLPGEAQAADAARRLRTLLQGAKNPRELRLYRTLWAAEFRVQASTGQDAVRRQVSADLDRLQPFENDETMRALIEHGAKLIGNDALAARMAKARKPDLHQAVMDEGNKWARANPQPKPGDPPEVRRAHAEGLMRLAQRWLEVAPDQVTGYSNRLRALVYRNAPDEEIARAEEALLAVIRNDPSGLRASWINSLIYNYLDNDVRLHRIPALVEEATARLGDPEAVLDLDLEPSPIAAENRQMLVAQYAEALAYLASYYVKRGDTAKARETLWRASDHLAAKGPSPEERNPNIQQRQSYSRALLLRITGEAAERDGRKLDALVSYRDAVATFPVARDEMLARQRRLWKELGGTDEGWQNWSAAPPAATPARPMAAAPERKQKLPSFSARDIKGSTWTLDNFANRTVIAVVWATWCEPCRAELPHFATLAARLKDRPDTLAVSFNTDENIDTAERYVQTNGFSFPVIWAPQYVNDQLEVLSIPRTWIIRDGTIVKEMHGFDGNNGKWVDSMLQELRL